MEGILFLVLSLVEEFSRVRTRERDWGRVVRLVRARLLWVEPAGRETGGRACGKSFEEFYFTGREKMGW